MGYTIERRIIKAISLMPLKSKDYIIAHEAGNPNNTGDNSLESEVKYMTSNWRKAFTHFWVGNKAIIQLAEDGFLAYGAGGYMNPHSPVQVEVARVDTQEEFDEAYKRYVWLLRHMADKYGIPKTLDSNDRRGIKTHEWVSKNLGGTTHVDPYGYFQKWGVSRAQFKRDIENGIVDKEVVTVSSYFQRGDKGSDISKLQTDLNKVGYKLAVDGSFGPATEIVVRKFQSDNKLAVDGLFGYSSKAKLSELLKVDKDWYRLVTGTFVGKEEAEKQAAKLRKERGWVVHVQKE